MLTSIRARNHINYISRIGQTSIGNPRVFGLFSTTHITTPYKETYIHTHRYRCIIKTRIPFGEGPTSRDQVSRPGGRSPGPPVFMCGQDGGRSAPELIPGEENKFVVGKTSGKRQSSWTEENASHGESVRRFFLAVLLRSIGQ